jgi:hypothetical protein
VTGDWRDWRPAIWLTMLGIAVMLLVSPFYFGAVFIGGAIGAAIRINQRRRRALGSARQGTAAARQRPEPRRRRRS